MAVFSQKCGGHKFKINDRDHDPPHCHVNIGGRQAQVDLYTFKILNPPPHSLPPNVRRCLKQMQEDMLKAWDKVKPLKP